MRSSNNMELFLLKSMRELKEAGVSQQRLSLLAGTSQATISSAVRGKPCKLETFCKIIDAIYMARGWSKQENEIRWNDDIYPSLTFPLWLLK